MKRLLLLSLLLAGCAIPVRPIARIVPDTDGASHFVADEAQEPHLSPVMVGGVAGVLGMLGPWGQVASLLVGALGVGAAGHVVGKKKGKKSAIKPALI